MEYGLECFDANGLKTFDTDLATSRYLGSGNTGTTDGSLTDANINNRKVWVVVTGHPLPTEAGVASWSWKQPQFTVSGNTISWTLLGHMGARPTDLPFIYGVYL